MTVFHKNPTIIQLDYGPPETIRGWIDEDLLEDKAFSALVDKLEGREFVAGRNRVVVFLKNYVLKLPRNFHGLIDNDWEASVSNAPETVDDGENVQYPNSRYAQAGKINVTFMERITHATDDEVNEHLGLPKGSSNWSWFVDCGQVGFTKRGRLVAYDYGLR